MGCPGLWGGGGGGTPRAVFESQSQANAPLNRGAGNWSNNGMNNWISMMKIGLVNEKGPRQIQYR